MYLATDSVTYISHYAQIYYYNRWKKMGFIQNSAKKIHGIFFPGSQQYMGGPKSSELSGTEMDETQNLGIPTIQDRQEPSASPLF